MLGAKFGKEFVEKASSDTSCRQFMVNENLIRFALQHFSIILQLLIGEYNNMSSISDADVALYAGL